MVSAYASGGVIHIACIFENFILFLFNAAANFDFCFVDVTILRLDQTSSKRSGECHQILQVALIILIRCITMLLCRGSSRDGCALFVKPKNGISNNLARGHYK